MVSRPVHSRSIRQSDKQLFNTVKVSVMMINVIPEPVDSPVPAGLAGANSGTNNTLSLVWQLVSEDDLSMEEVDDLSIEEVVLANLNFCNSVVGGPTSTPLKSSGLIVDLAGDVTVRVSSPAELAGDVTVGVSSPANLAGNVTVGVLFLADLAGDVTVGVSSRPTFQETSPSVCRSRPTLLEMSPSLCRPRLEVSPLLRWRPRPTLLR